MPGHRKERVPKHRALRPNYNSGRRVPVSAAIEAARTALQAAGETGQDKGGQDEGGQDKGGQDKGAQDSDGQPGPAAAPPTAPLGRPGALSRTARARGTPAEGTSRPQPRRMRGLLVTPWFAAGAGFVIAAALALNSPHTVLTYRPNTSKCSAACTAPGALATATPGLHFKPVPSDQPARPARGARRAPAGRPHPATVTGPEIGFQVVWRRNGAFGAIITVPAAQARHGWELRFEIPGRRILQVLGANWQPAPGGYGGLASMSASEPGQPGSPGQSRPSEPPGPGQPDTAGQSGTPGDGGRWGRQARRFLVTAQGSPIPPVACVLNGTGCHFG